MVDNRCAITKLVRDDRSSAMALWQRPHEPVHICRPGRCQDFLFCGGGPAVGDVLPGRPAEHPGVLQHHADLPAKIATPQLGDVAPIEGDAPVVELVEAHDQVDQSGLASAGRPDNGDGAARLPDEAHAAGISSTTVRVAPTAVQTSLCA